MAGACLAAVLGHGKNANRVKETLIPYAFIASGAANSPTRKSEAV